MADAAAVQAAHLVYGIPWTINCANYVFFKAMQECTALGSARATQMFLDEMLRYVSTCVRDNCALAEARRLQAALRPGL